MSFGSYQVPKPENKPTFLQYMKTKKLAPGVEGKTKYEVELIWLPGKFDNVTLVTHSFRYIASSNHPLYRDTIDWCDSVLSDLTDKSNSNCIAPMLYILIDSIKDKSISVHENPKIKMVASTVGSNGIKFVPVP